MRHRGAFYKIKRPQMIKTTKILVAMLLLGFATYGQEKQKEIKVETIKSGVVNPLISHKQMVRLYKHKNSRIKQALLFMTKKDKPKLI